MVGKLDEAVGLRRAGAGRSRLERAGVGAMEHPSLGRQELVVGRLLHERVTEGIALDRARAGDEQQLGVERLVQGPAQVGVGQAAHLGQHVVLDLAAGDGGDLDQVTRVLRSCRPAGPAGGRAACRGGRRGSSRELVGRGDELLGEERVAVGPPRDRLDQGRPELIARDHADHLDELVAVEPGQVDPLDPRLAFGLGEPAGQRMPAVKLVAAEGRDDEQALVAPGPGEEGQQVARRAVRPVRVLDDEQDRVRLAEPAEEPEDAVEDPDLEPVGLARRDRARIRAAVASSGTSRASSGRLAPAAAAIRSGSTSRDRARSASTIGPNGNPSSPTATEPPWRTSQPLVAEPFRELGHEAALADARLAADERDGGVPGRNDVGRGEERLELARPTDEHRAGQAPSHAPA